MATFDYGERVKMTLAHIEESDEIHEDNKDAIVAFKRDLTLDGISDARLQKLTSHLKILAEHLGETRFEDMTRDDVKDLVEWIHGRDIEPTTINDYKKVVKQFWKWLAETDDEFPEEVDWIQTTPPRSNGKLPKDLLTRDDVDALKDACRNARDRAFVALLYETGARIGEVIDLTVGDIEDHTHGRKVVVDGKTGQRRLPLVESTPALNRWLNDHPDPSEDAPLWCQLRDGSQQLSYNYLYQKVLQRAKDRAGIEKPVNPHHFRHSRATHLANQFKEAQLCEWFGWVQGSSVPGKYVHLSGRDIDDAYSKLHGLAPEDEDERTQTVRECPRCQELNEPEDQFCSRCGQALDVDAAEEVEQSEAKVTSDASVTDAELAMQIVQALRQDREQVAEFVEEFE